MLSFFCPMIGFLFFVWLLSTAVASHPSSIQLLNTCLRRALRNGVRACRSFFRELFKE